VGVLALVVIAAALCVRARLQRWGPAPVPLGERCYYEIEVSPDGSKVWVVQRGNDEWAVVVDRDKRTAFRVPGPWAGAFTGGAWSADGRQVVAGQLILTPWAWLSARRFAVVDTEAHRVRAVLPWIRGCYIAYARFSSNVSRVIYEKGDAPSNVNLFSVWSVGLDGRAAGRLAVGTMRCVKQPLVGDWLVFAGIHTEQGRRYYAYGRGGCRELLPDYAVAAIGVSRDSRNIAALCHRDRTTPFASTDLQLRVGPITGPDWPLVTEETFDLGYPRWSADGRQVLVMRDPPPVAGKPAPGATALILTVADRKLETVIHADGTPVLGGQFQWGRPGEVLYTTGGRNYSHELRTHAEQQGFPPS
jgi:hypothetical protein